MPTQPANARRFSDTYSAHKVGETSSESKFLATANFYGDGLQTRTLALDWSELQCRNCKQEVLPSQTEPLFVTDLFSVATMCSKCGQVALVPKAYVPDFVASVSKKIVVEIYGAKSSAKDAAKMEFYRANGFTAVTVPNDVADNPEYSKPIFQLLTLICGSDHPERLFAPELAK